MTRILLDRQPLIPEAQAPESIDQRLAQAGWLVQDNKAMNFGAGMSRAVCADPTAAGPADYVLCVDCQSVIGIEAKKDEPILSAPMERVGALGGEGAVSTTRPRCCASEMA